MADHDSVRYQLQDGLAVITIDDGKRNALPPAVFKGLYAALRRAEQDRAVVILTGREGVFSAGYDLKVMKAGNADTLRMLRAGYALTARIMGHPYPVIAACNGHCFAMGVFMMLSTDYIIGSRGNFQVSANEVAIGLTMPRVACTTLAQRLTPAAYQRAVTLAVKFAKLDMRAHAESKRRIRASQISAIRRQVPLDLLDAVKYGLRGGKPKA